MLTGPQEFKLKELARTYDFFTDEDFCPGDWAKHRTTLDGGAGGRILDDCETNPIGMKRMLDDITSGLVDDNSLHQENAKKACKLVQELYHNDPSVADSVNKAWKNNSVSLKQLKDGNPLEKILFVQRIVDEETKGVGPSRSEPPRTGL